MHAYSAYKEGERKRQSTRARKRGSVKRVLETLITWSCWRVTSSPSLFFAVRFASRREQTEMANGDGDVDEVDVCSGSVRARVPPVETEKGLNESQGTRVYSREGKKSE